MDGTQNPMIESKYDSEKQESLQDEERDCLSLNLT